MLSSWKKRRSTFIDIKPNFEAESSVIAKVQVCVPLKFGLVLQKVASFQVTIFIACQCFFCQPLHTLHLFTASTGHKTSSFGILNAVSQQVQVASFQVFLHVFSMQDWSLKCFDEISSFGQCFGHIPLTIPGIPFWTFCFFVQHSACFESLCRNRQWMLWFFLLAFLSFWKKESKDQRY